MRSTLLKKGRIAIVVLGLTGAFRPDFALAASTDSEVAIQNRLASVEKLIEDSSASRQASSAAGDEVCARRDNARRLLDEARRLADGGADATQLNSLLDEATREMLAAVRLAREESASSVIAEREYNTTRESLEALLDAYTRIRAETAETAETNVATTEDELQLLVQEKLAEAEQFTSQGDLETGFAILSEAYSAIKAAIEHLRGGETLVRRLEFETEADEYAYEIDRNDSLGMLVNVLLEERLASNETLANLVQGQVESAEALRLEGETLAGEARFRDAIATLEESTAVLIRAIRSAGIFIPH